MKPMNKHFNENENICIARLNRRASCTAAYVNLRSQHLRISSLIQSNTKLEAG